MNICLVTIGKFKSSACSELVQNYVKLAGRFAEVRHEQLSPPKNIPEHDAQNQALLKWLERQGPRVFLTLLDERGKSFESTAFSKKTQAIQDGSHSEWVIAVGGAHGYSDELKNRAQLLWSLSPLTFPHEMAAAVAAEQIYRALTLMHRHPYHNS